MCWRGRERQGSWGRLAAQEGRAGSFSPRQDSLPCLIPFLGITGSSEIVTGRQGQLHNVKDPALRSLNRGSLAWWQQASPAKFQHIGKLDVKKHETFYLDSGCQYKFFYMK